MTKVLFNLLYIRQEPLIFVDAEGFKTLFLFTILFIGLFILAASFFGAFWSYKNFTTTSSKLRWIDKIVLWSTTLLKGLFISLSLGGLYRGLVIIGKYSLVIQGQILCLLFIIGLSLLFLAHSLYYYKLREEFLVIFFIGIYGSFFLYLSDKIFFGISSLLATVVVFSSMIIGFSMFLIDSYQATKNKTTLWWKFQYINIETVMANTSAKLESHRTLWTSVYKINSQSFRVHVFWEVPILACLSLFSILFEALSVIGNTIILYIVVNLLSLNFMPIIVFYLILGILTCFCGLENFTSHIALVYGPDHLKKIGWNMFSAFGRKSSRRIVKIAAGGIVANQGMIVLHNMTELTNFQQELKDTEAGEKLQLEIRDQRLKATGVAEDLKSIHSPRRPKYVSFFGTFDIWKNLISGKGPRDEDN